MLKKTRSLALIILSLTILAFTPLNALALPTVNYSTPQEVFDYINVNTVGLIAGQSFSFIINGKTATVVMPAGAGADLYVNGVYYGLAAPSGGTYASVAQDPVVLAFMNAIGVSVTTAGSIGSPNSPTSVTTRVVFDNLVMSSALTVNEKKKEEAKRRSNSLRVLSSNISTEWVKNKNEDGRVYGFNLGLAYDFDKFTVGAVVPYDHLDNNIIRGDRAGTILFGQYRILESDKARLTATVNMNYLYSTYALNGTSYNNSTNVFGTGASLGGSYNIGKVELGAGLTYQYNKDDSSLADTDQHLVKLGSKVGLHITDNQVISALGYYTQDVTSYTLDYGKQNYFEVGGEYKLSLSDAWTLNLGYKKTLGLSNYRSDVATIGAVWMF